MTTQRERKEAQLQPRLERFCELCSKSLGVMTRAAYNELHGHCDNRECVSGCPECLTT